MNSVLKPALIAAALMQLATPAQSAKLSSAGVPAASGPGRPTAHRQPALVGADGEIRYAYGESHPEIRCAPLHLCVIALLRHEQIVNLSLGDSVRWLAQPAQAGDRPIIVLKPTTAGLRTNLVVTTSDGHLYYMDLVSGHTRFVPEIGFYDPRALLQTAHSGQAFQAGPARTVVASLPGVSLADLDFAYWWKGPRAERPVRVFSAHGKVYIQMPAHIRYGNAPAVFVVDHGAEQLVNYRMAGDYFVVDQLFQEARLVLGVGAQRRVVTIHAGHRPRFSW